MSEETNEKGFWEKLKNLYERKTPQNKTSLIKRLIYLQYKDGSSITKYMSIFQDIVNQMANLEIPISDLQACLLLSTLPKSLETLVVALNNSTPNEKFNMKLLAGNLLNEDTRISDQGFNPRFDADVTERR